MPKLNIPTILTLSRIVIIPIFIVLYYLQAEQSSNIKLSLINIILIALFAIVSMTDYLDGYLARKMKLISKLGEFLDPVADKLMVVTTLVLLIDFYHTWIITICSLIIITREVLISALREWMGRIGFQAQIKVLFIAKVKTILQFFAILFLLYNQPFLTQYIHAIGIFLLIIATILTIYSGFLYLRITLKTM